MKLSRTQKTNPWLANLIPVMDVVFLLLIFFLLSSSFILQPGVSVRPPFSKFSLGPVSNPRIISITSSPLPQLFFENEQVGMSELLARLSQATPSSRPIIIKADHRTPYDTVMRVANLCLEQGHSVILAASPMRTK